MTVKRPLEVVPGSHEEGSKTTEVVPRAHRRQFTAAYKLRILKEAETIPRGELYAMLRWEGLYSSHLGKWRRQREQGLLAALEPQTRGRKAIHDERDQENARLRKENEHLQKRLSQAEMIIDVQKKLSMLLGIEVRELPKNE